MTLLVSNSLLRRRIDAHAGFTLVELLAVMVIMTILLALVIPASTSLQESSNITFGGQIVGDKIALARQYAASCNTAIEVRFIAANSSCVGFNAIQLWQPNPTNGVQVPLDNTLTLPSNIEISSNGKLSPLVAPSTSGGLAAPLATMPAGSSTAGKSYVSFTVRPTGVVEVANPPPGNAFARQPSYFLTLLPNRYDTASMLPQRYLTIQINPDTAYIGVFQP